MSLTKFKNLSNVTGGFAFNTTILHGPDVIEPFVKELWQSDDARALADHFWGLHKAYKEVSDQGRSITMLRAAKSIYKKIDTEGTCGLSALNSPGLGISVAKEAFAFYIAGTDAQLTDRSRKLILSGHANTYAYLARVPLWSTRPSRSSLGRP